jgi:hypothetical protein
LFDPQFHWWDEQYCHISVPPKPCCISPRLSILAPKLAVLLGRVAITNTTNIWGDSSSIVRSTIPLVRWTIMPYYQVPQKRVVSHIYGLSLLSKPLTKYISFAGIIVYHV